MQIPQRWPIDWNKRGTGEPNRPTTLLMPRFPVPRGVPAELAALLPNTAYNTLLLDGLAMRSGGPRTTEMAAIFLADPFIDLPGFARTLERAGISRVANLPSVAQYGDAFAATAQALDVGLEREWRRLEQLASMGFEIYCCITSGQAAVDARQHLAPAGMIAVLPAMPSTGSDVRAQALNQLCCDISAAAINAVTLLVLAGERLSGLDPSLSDGQIRYGG